MIKKYLSLTIGIVAACATLANSQSPIAQPSGPGRFAICHDGNNWDMDDIYAMPMDYALLTAYGLQDKLVHMSHSVIWTNNASYYAQMKLSADAVNQFPGFKKGVQFDCQIPAEVIAGRANFKAQAEKSSANDKLYYLLAGPMDIPYHDIEAVSKEFRKYIVCVSHSNANEKMGVATGRKGWADIIKDFSADGVTFKKIGDQNASLGGVGSNKWDFLNSLPASTLMPPAACKWLRGRDFKANGDISDDGMLFFAITGRENGAVPDYEARFKAPLAPATTGLFAPMMKNGLINTASIIFSQNADELTVKVQEMQANGGVQMFNLLNQKIKSGSLNAGEAKVNLTGVPSGKYVLDIASKGQHVIKDFQVK